MSSGLFLPTTISTVPAFSFCPELLSEGLSLPKTIIALLDPSITLSPTRAVKAGTVSTEKSSETETGEGALSVS